MARSGSTDSPVAIVVTTSMRRVSPLLSEVGAGVAKMLLAMAKGLTSGLRVRVACRKTQISLL